MEKRGSKGEGEERPVEKRGRVCVCRGGGQARWKPAEERGRGRGSEQGGGSTAAARLECEDFYGVSIMYASSLLGDQGHAVVSI